MLGGAMAVVAQHLDDPAVGDPALAGRRDDSLKFAAQGTQTRDLAVDGGELLGGEDVGLLT